MYYNDGIEQLIYSTNLSFEIKRCALFMFDKIS